VTNSEEVLTLIREVFGRQLGVPMAEVDPDIPAIALDGIESVQLLSAIAQIEDALVIAIPDDVLLDSLTLRGLAEVATRLPRRIAIR
jgi:acyl carrier protein